MNPATVDAIRAHAAEDYPREACGLVAIVKGRERYIPCRNVAITPSEHFILSSEDYANADELGELVTVVHSHPDVPARPSEADRVACEASGLPWVIVAVARGDDGAVAGEMIEIRPEGYQAPLVGRPFAHGVLDCYSVIRDWFARERGIELPDFERQDGWWYDGCTALYLEHFREAGFEPAAPPLQAGDVIMMKIESRDGRRVNDTPNHAAVYLGDGLMLHHLYGRLSSRDVYGGMWAEKTMLVVRYRGMA